MKRVNIIVATCIGGGIGYRGGIPWVLPADLLRFRRLTMGRGRGLNAVVMGRCTWQGLPTKLMGRRNVVVSGTGACARADGAEPDAVYPTLEAAWGALKADASVDEVWVIGGERLYAEALRMPATEVGSVHRTVVHAEKPCDRFFPDLIYKPRWRLRKMSDDLKDGMYVYHYEEWDLSAEGLYGPRALVGAEGVGALGADAHHGGTARDTAADHWREAEALANGIENIQF